MVWWLGHGGCGEAVRNVVMVFLVLMYSRELCQIKVSLISRRGCEESDKRQVDSAMAGC